MSAKALIGVVTLCLLSTINAQTTINNQIYGAATTNLAAGAYVINYLQAIGGTAGASLSITVSASCTVTLSAYLGATLNSNINANSGIALPSTFISVDIGAGYTLAISAGSASNIQLVTSSASTAFTALLVANTNAGVVQVNSANQVTAVVPATYNSANQKLTINLPDVGTYAIVAVKSTVTLPSAATAGFYYANATVTFDWGNNVKVAFFSRTQSTSVSQSFSTTYTQGSAAAAAWAKALGAYVTVGVGTATDYSGTLSYTYTDAQLTAAGITDASKLRFAVYNTATTNWQVPASGGSVDTSARVVSQATTSFSEWGVYYTGSSATKAMLNTVAVAVAMLLPLLGVSLL